MDDLPALHVAVLVPPGGLARAADSLDALGMQTYPQVRVSVLADQRPSDPALLESAGLEWVCYSSVQDIPRLLGDLADNTSAAWLCLLDGGDRLAEGALFDAARYAARYPEWQMLYTDDDYQGDDRELPPPRFKPDFNLSLLRCQPYIGSCVLIRPAALRNVGGLRTLDDWRGADLALRVADRFGHAAVGHVPRVIVHYADDHACAWSALSSAGGYLQSVRAHLERRCLEADVVPGHTEETLHVRLVRHDQPLVSIIMRGGNPAERQLSLQTLLAKTGYTNYEVLVLQDTNAEDVDPDVLPHEGRIRPLAASGLSPGAAMNAAAAAARGEYLLWFDGRCLVLHTDWLDRMLRQIAEPDVGIVGARLVDRRKALLDGGLVLGMGARCVGARANTGLHMSSPGYLNRALCEQDLSAVTSLCMLVRKSVHAEAGGFSPDISTDLYRDVDYCLNVGEKDWRIVWTPAVTLMFIAGNAEADRPPKDKTVLDADIRRTLNRWFIRIANERAFNRNLDHLRSDFQLDLNTVPSWDPIADRLPRILGFGTGSFGSWQYRVCQPLAALDAAGMAQCAQTPFADKKAVVLPTPVDIEHMQPQTLLLHNTLHDNHLDLIEQYRRYNRVSLVFGQDDLMFALPSKNPYSKTVYKDIKKRIRRCIEMADRVVVTTEPLADALREFSAEIEVVPNYLPRSVWSHLLSRRRQGQRPRVGWAGAQQHGGDLELLYEVVESTADEVDWVFFGMCPDPLRRYVREVHRAVAFAEYPARLAGLDLDLAVAPLERNRFNEAKSNLRVLEYGVLGWPVIASDIEPYQSAPVCRVANTPGAWIRAIREHVSDRDALAKKGDALQTWVGTHWMLEDRLNDWLAVLCTQGAQHLRGPYPREAVIRC
jgi:GT2 family glycosyltransferase/glycosyltransferase involved in cell wall biosynthesis